MLKLKHDVTLNGMQPEMLLAVQVVHSVYSALGVDGCVITSVTDGEHSPGSLHYVGYAVDFRIPSDRRVARQLSGGIANALTREFDVVLESDHLHIEFQPNE